MYCYVERWWRRWLISLYDCDRENTCGWWGSVIARRRQQSASLTVRGHVAADRQHRATNLDRQRRGPTTSRCRPRLPARRAHRNVMCQMRLHLSTQLRVCASCLTTQLSFIHQLNRDQQSCRHFYSIIVALYRKATFIRSFLLDPARPFNQSFICSNNNKNMHINTS